MLKNISMKIFGVLAGLLLTVSLRAAGPVEGSQVSFARTLWRVGDGLPENIVQSLALARDGALWIGTTGGLGRFDGTHIQPVGGLSAMFPAKSVFYLDSTRNGDLWVGTEGGGLLLVRHGKLQSYVGQDILSHAFVRSVFEDSRGTIWVATDSGLFRRDGDKIRPLSDSGESFGGVHAITEDSQGRLWAGGGGLFSIAPDGAIQRCKMPGASGENMIKSLLATRDGTLWIGTVRGLESLRGGRFHLFSKIHVTVRSMLLAQDGTLWIGTLGEGLWNYKDGQLRRIQTAKWMPSQTILSLLQDPSGQIWIGTQGGLMRLNRSEVQLVPLPDESDSDYQTISEDAQGSIWVASDGTFRIHDGKVSRVHFPQVGNLAVRNVLQARDGALWIGTEGGGAFRIAGAETTRFTAPAQLPNNFVRGFMEARDGAIWVLTGGGVSRIGRNDVTKFSGDEGLIFGSTRSIFEDDEGTVWIGTDRGVVIWKNRQLQDVAALRRLAQEKVWSIVEDRKQILWFATRDHGLFRLKNGVLEQFSQAEGMPTDSFYQILQDRNGLFWLSGPGVIATAEESQMDDERPSLDRPLAVRVLRMPAGAEDIQLYGGRQPSGLVADDDTVWFPTSKGAAHILAVPPDPVLSPQLEIDRVDEDGESQAATSSTLQISSRVRRLGIHYSMIYLLPRDRLRIRYKLENFDHEWVEGDASQTATYTNLPPGTYTFHLQTIDEEHPETIAELSYPVHKEPAVYQRWWFYLLCFGAAALLGWIIYRLRIRRMHARFEAVLAERNRVAREMHDTLIQGCTSISALLEGAGPGADPHSPREELLVLARAQVLRTIMEARKAIWNLRHEHEKQLDFVGALKRLTTQSAAESGNTVELRSPLPCLEVNSSVAHELLMVIREAMNNSLRHSGAPSVLVEVHVKNDDLTISVSDHGCGFDFRAGGLHFGILGMAERMRRLGGGLHVQASPGQGTAVIATVRYTKASRLYSGRR